MDGSASASVGRCRVLDTGTLGPAMTLTHAYAQGADNPVVEEHPDLEALPK